MKRFELRIYIVLSISLCIMGFSQDVFALTAKEAFMALKKLQMKCEAGILYSDYVPALSEAKVPVTEYLESPASKNAPEFSDAVSSAVAHYDCAKKIFEYMFRAGAGQHFVSTQDPALFARIRQTYPELHIYEQKDVYGFSYAEAIQIMWAKAASQIERAFENIPSPTAVKQVSKIEKEAEPDKTDATDSRLKRQNNALKHEIKRLKVENKELRRELDALKKRQ